MPYPTLLDRPARPNATTSSAMESGRVPAKLTQCGHEQARDMRCQPTLIMHSDRIAITLVRKQGTVN